MAATIKIPTTFTAVDKFSTVVKKMTGGVKKFGKTGGAAIKRFDTKLTNSVKKIGKVGALVGGLALGTLFSSAIQGNIAYNKSLQSVATITGATKEQLADFEKLSLKTGKAQNMLGADVLKAYELIGSAQPELLKNSKALDEVTNSAITLSKASGLELADAAGSLTDVMNQFNLKGVESKRVIDVLAAGAKEGAAAIPLIKDAMLVFGTGASAFNVSLEESTAAIELLAARGKKGAEAGTILREVMTKMSAIDALPKSALDQLKKYGVNTDIVSDKNLTFSERLKEMSKVAGDTSALVKVFGAPYKDMAAVLLKNTDELTTLTGKMTQNGLAAEQAETNTNTLAFSLESIKTAFTNATTATNSGSKSLDMVKDVLKFVATNMETVIGVGAVLLGSFVALKIVVGIMSAISAAKLWYTTTATAAAVAQTSFAAAVWASMLPILAIIAVIAAVVLIFKNWGAITDWFSEKWTQFTAFISEAWQNVVKWFTNFDFKALFMDIGQSILKFMLMPLKGMLTILSKVPGKIGEIASMGLDKIGEVTGEIGVNGENNEVLPSTAQKSAEITSKSVTQNNLAIDINDKGGNVGNITQSGKNEIPVNVTSTQGAF